MTIEDDDKLTEINGLGKAAERDLHSVGIRRFDDLIKHTPEELAKKLYERTQQARYSAALIKNSDWIGQARYKLAERKKAKNYSSHANSTARANIQPAGNQAGDWQLQAEFNLYFEHKASEQGGKTWQTRVWKLHIRDRDCDKEITFHGVEPRLWVNWILRQADLPTGLALELDEPSTAAASASVAPEPTQVSILNVQVEAQPALAVHPQTLTATIHFTVSGANVELLMTESIPYQIFLLLVDLQVGLWKLVAAEQGLLQPEQMQHTHRLGFPLPALGRYELQTLVLIQSQVELITVYRGPTFKVTQG